MTQDTAFFMRKIYFNHQKIFNTMPKKYFKEFFLKSYLKYVLLFCLASVNFLVPAIAFSASVTATVDRNVLSVGETFQLQVKIDTIGSWATPQILGSLEQDFTILGGPHRSQRQVVINGNFESSIEWTYQLSAKRTGQLQIPSFQVDQFQSMPISVVVNQQPISSTNKFANRPNAIVDVQADKKEVFLFEQIFLTVKIYTRENIQGRLDFGDLDAQFKMVNLGDQREYLQNMEGTNYQVHEFHFALFPKSVGDFPIGPVTVQSNQQQQILGLFAVPSGQSISIQSEVIPIKVLNPKNNSSQHLIGESVSLTEEWSPTIPANGTPEVAVGEPLTRQIEVRVVGQTESHIP
ncbi:MAG: BatD family protein, partial [Pseudomonadota bacterium]